jgi:alpha-tubulin suppressor-like RCC1 family protein
LLFLVAGACCAGAAGCGIGALLLGDRDGGGGADGAVPPTGAPLALDAGEFHTCAAWGGVAYCWGQNQGGALGVGDALSRTVPTRVAIASAIRDLALGEAMSCAILDGDPGAVSCWGQDDVGQLGLAPPPNGAVLTPTSNGLTAATIAAGFAHACAVGSDARLTCWGDNAEGQLGLGPGGPPSSAAPVEVAPAAWASVAVGQGHTCAVRTDGSLWCWGRNTSAQLGTGSVAPLQIQTPTAIGSSTAWRRVTAGQDTTCGLQADGTIWCWGVNAEGQCGQPRGTPLLEPTQVSVGGGWLAVSTGTFATCAIAQDGGLWCWGRNAEGQLGLGTSTPSEAPQRVGTDADWLAIAVGRFHACAQKRDGAVLCAGENSGGQLGVGDADRRKVLTPVVAP